MDSLFNSGLTASANQNKSAALERADLQARRQRAIHLNLSPLLLSREKTNTVALHEKVHAET